LAPSEIAAPIRQLEAKQENLSVLLAEVKSISLVARTVEVVCPGIGDRKLEYDFLVIAAGMNPSYFGHDEFARFAPGPSSSQSKGQRHSMPGFTAVEPCLTVAEPSKLTTSLGRFRSPMCKGTFGYAPG
jgi:NADH dehydrogenase FAD-containing subunit